MTKDQEVITYWRKLLPLHHSFSPPRSASLSLIHLNLIPIASSAVGQSGRAVSLTVELAFVLKHFADGEHG